MRNIAWKSFLENYAILGNIQQTYNALNNRHHDRVKVGKNVYALMSWNTSKDQVFLGHLIDINKEGCGISYVTERKMRGTALLQKTCKLKFMSTLKMFELEMNTIIYDYELIEYSTERISARRCGIKFDNFVRVEHLR
jgi:hypothetical protein